MRAARNRVATLQRLKDGESLAALINEGEEEWPSFAATKGKNRIFLHSGAISPKKEVHTVNLFKSAQIFKNFNLIAYCRN